MAPFALSIAFIDMRNAFIAICFGDVASSSNSCCLDFLKGNFIEFLTIQKIICRLKQKNSALQHHLENSSRERCLEFWYRTDSCSFFPSRSSGTTAT